MKNILWMKVIYLEEFGKWVWKIILHSMQENLRPKFNTSFLFGNAIFPHLHRDMQVCLNSIYRLWGLVMETKKVKFCIGTHVLKNTTSSLQTNYHNITCWTFPHLLLTVRCFPSGSTYKKASMWRPATSTHELDLRDHCGIRWRHAGAGYGCGGCRTSWYWWSCAPEHGTYRIFRCIRCIQKI